MEWFLSLDRIITMGSWNDFHRYMELVRRDYGNVLVGNRVHDKYFKNKDVPLSFLWIVARVAECWSEDQKFESTLFSQWDIFRFWNWMIGNGPGPQHSIHVFWAVFAFHNPLTCWQIPLITLLLSHTNCIWSFVSLNLAPSIKPSDLHLYLCNLHS
jgi:hypothetical protein